MVMVMARERRERELVKRRAFSYVFAFCLLFLSWDGPWLLNLGNGTVDKRTDGCIPVDYTRDRKRWMTCQKEGNR